MSKILNFLFLVTISSNFICKANDEVQNPVVAYKSATVQLDHTAKPVQDPPVVVVNKQSTVGVDAPYAKYALFDAESGGYFTAQTVKLKDTELTVDDAPVTLSYVYDVYTYWKGGQLLVFAFRHYYAGVSSLYKYYVREKETWKLVDGTAFEAEQTGFLRKDKLTKLLNDAAEKNKEETGADKPEEEKSGLSTNTKVVVGVVLGFVVLLLLVGLVFFLKR